MFAPSDLSAQASGCMSADRGGGGALRSPRPLAPVARVCYTTHRSHRKVWISVKRGMSFVLSDGFAPVAFVIQGV